MTKAKRATRNRDSDAAVPFLKWAGGKSQLLAAFAPLFPAEFGDYYEPFIGAGAVFFHLARRGTVRAGTLSDANEDLVRTYVAVRDEVEPLIDLLEEHQQKHDKDHFLASRSRFNEESLSDLERAALLIYLNRTCFNGLYRVNRKGHFNVPMGSYVNPRVAFPQRLRAVSAVLQGVAVRAGDFAASLTDVREGDFVYLDPPYVPLTTTANFTAYAKGGFDFSDQRRLADTFRALAERGAKVMLSNHATDELIALYDGFDVKTISAKRRINSRADRRGDETKEVVVRNYTAP